MWEQIKTVEPKKLELKNRFQVLEEQGTKEVNAVEATTEVCGMMFFHLTDAKRMLASVDKIASAGNEVKFGPAPTDNYVKNLKTGKTIPLKKKNGVYVMEVYFLDGDRKILGEIIVDSGAAECVMPKDMLPNLEKLSAKVGIRFAAANGGEMGNYGRKLINFLPRGFSTRV